MFCKNCGNQLADNAMFCGNCGTPVSAPQNFEAEATVLLTDAPSVENTVTEAQPVQQAPVKPVQPVQQVPVQPVQQMPVQQVVYVNKPSKPSFFQVAFGYIKGFFSANITKTIETAAKSKGLEWLVFAIASVFVFAVSMTLNVKYVFEYASIGTLFSLWFANIFIGTLAFGGLAALVFATMRVIFKKNVSFFAALNMVGYATFPITLVLSANVIMGLIYVPLAVILYLVALIASFCLVYIGMQKLDKLEVTPFVAFVVIVAIVVSTVALIGGAIYGEIIGNVFGGLFY